MSIPQFGGTLDFNCMGVAGCYRCGWRGVPTTLSSTKVGRVRYPWGTPEFPQLGHPTCDLTDVERSTFCPICTDDHAELLSEIRREIMKAVPTKEKLYAGTARNAPCPCGSGVKYKRCHGK